MLLLDYLGSRFKRINKPGDVRTIESLQDKAKETGGIVYKREDGNYRLHYKTI